MPIEVTGSNAAGASDDASAVLTILPTAEVLIELDPVPAQGGPGMPTVVTVTVTNIGDAAGTFDLAVNAPIGWELS